MLLALYHLEAMQAVPIFASCITGTWLGYWDALRLKNIVNFANQPERSELHSHEYTTNVKI